MPSLGLLHDLTKAEWGEAIQHSSPAFPLAHPTVDRRTQDVSARERPNHPFIIQSMNFYGGFLVTGNRGLAVWPRRSTLSRPFEPVPLPILPRLS